MSLGCSLFNLNNTYYVSVVVEEDITIFDSIGLFLQDLATSLSLIE